MVLPVPLSRSLTPSRKRDTPVSFLAPLPEPEPEATPEPAPTPEEELRWSKSEVLQPTQPTKASESGYFEWTGASTLRGSWKLRDAATEELARGADANSGPEAAPAAASRP